MVGEIGVDVNMGNIIIGEESYLDLKKVDLWGCDMGSCDLVIKAMADGIKLGHKFPLGYVTKISENEYYLLGDANHRSLAHDFGGVPFPCKVVNENYIELKFRRNLLNSIPLVSFDFLNRSHQVKLKRSLEFLPPEVAQNFCLEHELNSKYFLSQ